MCTLKKLHNCVNICFTLEQFLPGSEADLQTLAAAGEEEFVVPEKPNFWLHLENMGVM